MKKDFYLGPTTDPSRETETKNHARHHIRDWKKKQTLLVVTIDTKGNTESHTNNQLRHHYKTTSDLRFIRSETRSHPHHHPNRTDRKPGSHCIRPYPQSPRCVRSRTRTTTEWVYGYNGRYSTRPPTQESGDLSVTVYPLPSPSYWETQDSSHTTTTVTDTTRAIWSEVRTSTVVDPQSIPPSPTDPSDWSQGTLLTSPPLRPLDPTC